MGGVEGSWQGDQVCTFVGYVRLGADLILTLLSVKQFLQFSGV